MTRTNTTDAFITTCLILFVLAILGDPTDTGKDWFIRAVCVYPFTHLAWREYRRQN
jgi:hypothetical protein